MEGNTTRGRVGSAAVLVAFVACLGGAATATDLPNLLPTYFYFTGGAVEGSPITITVSIQNTGTAASPAFHARMWLSPNRDFNTGDDYDVGERAVGALARGATVDVPFTFTMPDMAAGNYQVWVIVMADSRNEVEESNEWNTIMCDTPLSVTGSSVTPKPDLQVTDREVQSTLVTEGSAFFVRGLVRNAGTAAAGATVARLYLSTDNDVELNDDYVVGDVPVPALAAGNESWVRWDFTMPNLGSGTYNVWAILVADATGLVAESDEQNAFRTTSPDFQAKDAGTFQYSYWLAVGSHVSGAGGTQWRTDLGVLNASGASASIEVRLYTSGGVISQTATVPAGAQSVFTDVVGQLGHSGSGAIEVASSRPVRVTSRTYNQTPAGTYGQDYGAYPAGSGMAAGQSAFLGQLAEDANYRTNIGLTNTGTSPATVQVKLFDAAGSQLTVYSVTLAPGEWKQENRPFFTRAGQTNMTRGYAQVVVSAGSGIIAYASVIDARTGDPITRVMLP